MSETTNPTAARSADTDAKTTLDRFYEAEMAYLAAGGADGGAPFDGLAAMLHPEVVMHQAAGLPYGGDWTGPDGIERWFQAMSDTWSTLDVSDTRFFVEGDTVVITLRLTATARATGRVIDAPMVQVVRVDDGLIRDFRPFYWDTAAVAAACATDSQSTPG